MNFCTGQAIFTTLDPHKVIQLDRSTGKHLWMDLFDEMEVIGKDKQAIFDTSEAAINSSYRPYEWVD